jgi:hypothetical protein
MLERDSWSVTNRRATRGAVILLIGLAGSSCAQVFGAAVGASVQEAAGEEAGRVVGEAAEAMLEEPEPASVTSIYRTHPSAAWEDDLRVTPSATRPEVFRHPSFTESARAYVPSAAVIWESSARWTGGMEAWSGSWA